MKMQPTDIGDFHFNMARLYDAELNLSEGDVIFEIELRLRHLDQRFFVGIMATPELSGLPEGSFAGIGVCIDPESGEVTDAVNGQGVIGYLDHAPLETNESIFLCLEAEKLNRIFIPKLTVGEEKLLHPALHMEHGDFMSLMVGSTDVSRGAVFENPHFVITRRFPGSVGLK